MPPRWDQALVWIASAKDPSNLGPRDDNKVLFYDEHTITIYDKFAKAQYHFLVLPRIPFKRSEDPSGSQQGVPKLTATNGKLNFGATSSNVVPASHMKSISTMVASPYAGDVLRAMRTASDRVVEHIRADMEEHYGVIWDVERAFHAVPSMEHLHLHVVSMDLVSDRLKHKKHYLSFHPAVGFALRLSEVERMVAEGKNSLPKSELAYEQLLKGPLKSHHTDQVLRFMPEMKVHLEWYWRNKILAAADPASTKAGVKRDATEASLATPSTTRGASEEQRRKVASGDDSDDEPLLPLKK